MIGPPGRAQAGPVALRKRKRRTRRAVQLIVALKVPRVISPAPIEPRSSNILCANVTETAPLSKLP
jgi:hypothetical protein